MNKYKWKNQFHFNPSASALHEAMRMVLVTELPFKNFACYQEVPVVDLVPGYDYPSHRFDWYIEELGVVIELHGAQHYRPVNFGGIGYDDLVVEFRDIKFRDSVKEAAAKAAGLVYLALPHTMWHQFTGPGLMKLISEAANG